MSGGRGKCHRQTSGRIDFSKQDPGNRISSLFTRIPGFQHGIHLFHLFGNGIRTAVQHDQYHRLPLTGYKIQQLGLYSGKIQFIPVIAFTACIDFLRIGISPADS